MMEDLHPVILSAGRGSRMYPLTEERPKALLPVCNRPMIWYPVQLLEKHGFTVATVLVGESSSQQVSTVLESFQNLYGVRMKFSLVTVPDNDTGTADSLRTLKGKVKGDLLVVSCDLISTVDLHGLIDFHQATNSTFTALLAEASPPEDDSRKKQTASVERDIIGLTESSQLVYFGAKADLDDNLVLSRALLNRHPYIRFHSQLLDAHLYVMKRWVIDYLNENRSISSVKAELIPHFMRHNLLFPSQTSQKEETGRSSSAASRYHVLSDCAQSCVDSFEQQAYGMSSFTGLWDLHDNHLERLLHCHALVVKDQLCLRVNTLPLYMEANRLLQHQLSKFSIENEQPSSQPRVKGVSQDCSVGSSLQIHDKVSVKRSCIGNHCSVGEKTKIVGSVLMDHVTVGEGCTIQGSVICSHVHVEEGVSLKDCHVGANYTVTKDADLRGETLVVDRGLHF